MSLNPKPTAWRVVRIDEDERSVAVTLARCTWSRDVGEEEVADAEPGEPGAFWSDDGPKVTIELPPAQAMVFDVGRHYVMALTEIVDAPRIQYEPAGDA